jgi:hypothetical protein
LRQCAGFIAKKNRELCSGLDRKRRVQLQIA